MPLRPIPVGLLAAVLFSGAAIGAGAGDPAQDLDRAAGQWVADTLRRMTLDEKVGQLLMPSFESTYVSTDSDVFDSLARLVHEQHVGGFIVFGGREPAPRVLLNPTYGTVILGQPLEAASLINRLQAISRLPLLTSADFETGVRFRIAGATAFPRAMAFGAAGDERLAFEAARITAIEARALGIHVNFAPVADVNNNPRNPVINTRSFGEDPKKVAALASAYVRGLREGGMLATLKHFPGHGDTDVDTHLGLATILHPRARLEAVELVPFREGLAAGADAVMTGHIEMPAVDPAEGMPATFSGPVVTGLLRGEMGFDGLVFTDSMSMRAVAEMLPPGEAAVRAVRAGNDLVLHSPDDGAAFDALKAAVERGEIAEAQIDASVRRILRAKAGLGLHRNRAVSLDTLPEIVGRRAHQAVAGEISQRSLTLIRDERRHVPLPLPRDASLLYLSVLDYPGGWRIAAPSRTFIPGLRERWADVTAVELSDRTAPAELELVRRLAARADGIVASVFVRASASSGRMDLSPALAGLLQELAGRSAETGRPFVTVLFGNPYVAAFLPELPAVLLTYDFYDLPEQSAVRALAGEAPIGGRLPIALPGLFDAGHGLQRLLP